MLADSIDTALHDLRWLHRLAVLLTADADEADDLVQDTLVVAWSDPPRDRVQPLRPWLATVLRNLLRMRRRAGARRTRREHGLASGTALVAAPDDDLARVEVLRILVSELERLAPDDRKILVRRYFHDESAADISRALAIPAATVRSRIHRSLQRLRRALDDQHGPRARWTAAVLAAPPSPAPDPTGGSTMTLATKFILATTLVGVGVAGWLGGADDPDPAPTPTPASAASPAATAPDLAWAARRAAIRQRLPASPPSPLVAPRPDDDSGLRGLVRACMTDLESEASGAITLQTTQIGAPDIGTIYDEVTLIETTFPEPEVVECLIQSMHAWVGEAPAESFTRTYNTTFTLGQPTPELRDRRVFEAIVGAHISEVRWCERRGDADAPEARGALQLVLPLTDDGNGHARATRAIGLSDELPRAVVDCIVAASERWVFPVGMHERTYAYDFTLPIPGTPLVGPARNDE